MATETAVQDVKDQLPADAAQHGWDAQRIGNDLDGGKTQAKILLGFWTNRAANTFTLTPVQESGSSRGLDTIHRNALAMQKYWQDRVDSEEKIDTPDPGTETPTRGPGIYTHPIRRIARS